MLKWPKTKYQQANAAEEVFREVAPRYRQMKWLLSGGLEPGIKSAALDRHVRGRTGRFLDLACGTGDVLEWLSVSTAPSLLVGVDISRPMMARIPDGLNAALVVSDINNLPFREASFQTITVAYGIRYTEPEDFAKTCFDLLEPSGRLFLFDLSNPRSAVLRSIWHAILLVVGTCLGLILHGRLSTYWHLVETLRVHPSKRGMCDILKKAGFHKVLADPVLGGLMVTYLGDK